MELYNSYAHQVGLEVRAMTDIKAGHEVLIQYGTRSDDELLLNYGFVLGPGTRGRQVNVYLRSYGGTCSNETVI